MTSIFLLIMALFFSPPLKTVAALFFNLHFVDFTSQPWYYLKAAFKYNRL